MKDSYRPRSLHKRAIRAGFITISEGFRVEMMPMVGETRLFLSDPVARSKISVSDRPDPGSATCEIFGGG